MSEKLTLFIDESGEAGVSKVRSETSGGASQYMTLGGALIRNTNGPVIRKRIEDLQHEFKRKYLHCSELKHEQKIYYARELSKQKIKFFGLISRKATLGSYRLRISDDSKRYYNKCASYLLERVGRFINENSFHRDDLDIIFEEGNFDYEGLKTYIRKCQDNPINSNARYLTNINADNIKTAKKNDDIMLCTADLNAHALYKCVDKHQGNYYIPEPRYYAELRDKFFKCNKSGRVEGAGLKVVHQLSDLNLDSDVYEALDC